MIHYPAALGDDDDQFVTVAEAAERMNTTPEHVTALIRTGALRTRRLYGQRLVEPAIVVDNTDR